MIGTGGIVLDPPEKASKDHKVILDEVDIQEWSSAVSNLLSDEAEYGNLSCAAKQSAQTQHSIDERTENLIDVLKPLTDRRAGDKPFVRSSYC
jgi:glycosyltransferase involved in cell wall biosynthesis